MASIAELKQRLSQHNEDTLAIQAKADEEKRDLTEEEQTEINDLFSGFEATNKEIGVREQIQANNRKLWLPEGRKTEPNDPKKTDPPPDPNKDRIESGDAYGPKGKAGWQTFGQFSRAVHMAAIGGQMDERLTAFMAPTTVSTEGVGVDGGFAVPPDFRDGIVEKVFSESELLSMTDGLTTASNAMTFPIDETTDWQSSGGIQAFWEGENRLLTQSKIALQSTTVRANKITALVPVTSELLEDTSGLDAYLNRKAPAKINFKVSLGIVQGTGVGQPLGILTSPALVSVAAEGGQTADTIVYANITKMWSRMYAPSRRTAIWLINQDIEPQLAELSLEGTSSSVPAYLPQGGLSVGPFSTLMGRPVVPTQACNTLGDKGDIILSDMAQYLSVTKTPTIRAETSIHLWFDYDTTAFRFIMRIGGQPWLSAPITPRSGSANTLSPFVTLAERA